MGQACNRAELARRRVAAGPEILILPRGRRGSPLSGVRNVPLPFDLNRDKMTPGAQVPILIDTLIVAAIQRLLGAMGEHTPYMAQRAAAWFTGLAKSDHPEDYFKHPLAFPMLLLPWWLEQTLTSSPDLTFQADLVYS